MMVQGKKRDNNMMMQGKNAIIKESELKKLTNCFKPLKQYVVTKSRGQKKRRNITSLALQTFLPD